MRIAYYDESGDDGFPKYSSPIFVLTAVYLHYLKWKESFETILQFRRQLKSDFKFPVKIEFHTKYFLLNKNPYRSLNISERDRILIISRFCKLISSLDLKIINTVILKTKIKNRDYNILDTSLKYSVQRIENDIKSTANPNERFLIITDTGRVGKMRLITRRIQKINYIPSKFFVEPYRREIKSLIEDPLPKESDESFFIQIADLVSYIITLYTISKESIGSYPNRLKDFVNPNIVISWLDDLRAVLNLKASQADEYGIVYHPK